MENNPPKKDDVFTSTQVGVLIEEFRSQFRSFGEWMDIFDKTLKDVRDNQARTLERVTLIELTQRKILTTLEGHDSRLARLESVFLK